MFGRDIQCLAEIYNVWQRYTMFGREVKLNCLYEHNDQYNYLLIAIIILTLYIIE